MPLQAGTAAFGEIGLSGEVRPVSQRARRVAEAKKLGFAHAIAPPTGGRSSEADGTTIARDIAEAIVAALG